MALELAACVTRTATHTERLKTHKEHHGQAHGLGNQETHGEVVHRGEPSPASRRDNLMLDKS